MPRIIDRRTFLGEAGGALALSLTAGRRFTAVSSANPQSGAAKQVLVIGAGLAGLAAA